MNTPPALRALLPATLLALLGACASAPESIVQGPVSIQPVAPPASLERAHTGSLFRTSTGSLYSGRQKPRAVGDTLKIEISESLSASNVIKNENDRSSSLSSKGPGGASADSPISGLLNQDITASGSSTFKGNGTTRNDASFTGLMTAAVINVLPNGNLVVAGERSMSMHGAVNTLRFSGVVNPKDIADGNVVQSPDVLNASLEVVGKGELAENSTRNWLQKVLNRTLSVW